MKSKGGKIFYRCHECYSTDIIKQLGTSKLLYPGKTMNMFLCNTCGMHDLWINRNKQSVLHYFNWIRPLTYMRKGNNVFIQSHGITYKLYRVRVHPGMLYEKNYPLTSTMIQRQHYYDKAWITIDGKKHEIHGGLK